MIFSNDMKKIDFQALLQKAELKGVLAENTPKALILNILLMTTMGVVLLVGFFLVYLPVTTHHSETITVPDLQGRKLDEVEKLLSDLDLRYIVADSGYDDQQAPLTILKQDPTPNARVKINRRIHLTIRSLTPPKENLPDLYDSQVKMADRLLKSYGFKSGKITYVPDLGTNAILKVYVKGKLVSREQIKQGFSVEKGTAIDLEVGDGMGNSELILPDFSGKPLVEVEVHLRGVGLGLGRVIYENNPNKEVGTVLRQNPPYSSDKKIRIGDVVDLWVAGFEPKKD